MFTVQIRLDGDDLPTRIAEVSEWFKIHRVAPGAFQYKMRPEHVRLRVDFTTLREAAAFAEELGGSVLGAKRVDQAAD
jgi:hypothetical protein